MVICVHRGIASDIEGVKPELDAVNEYLVSLDKKCTYNVESYAARKARREAEATEIRDADKAKNQEAIADAKVAQEAVEKATKVIQEQRRRGRAGTSSSWMRQLKTRKSRWSTRTARRTS